MFENAAWGRAGRRLVAVVLMASATAAPAAAKPVFLANFQQENGGQAMENYTTFTRFTVSSGSVDLVGNGFDDYFSGRGLYVDMCGSTRVCGTLTTKRTFLPGRYLLSLNLGGNGRNNTPGGVHVSWGSFQQDFLTPVYNKLYSFKNVVVTLTSPAQLSISDLGLSGDGNVGTTLFAVSISKGTPPVAR